MKNLDYYFLHFPILETDRLILRAKCALDAEDMKTYTADESLYKYWGRNMTKNEKEPELMFTKNLNCRKDCLSWGIELKVNHRLVGEINLFDFHSDRQAMVGYRLAAAYQGIGIVTEALRRVIRFCFEDTPIQRLEAEVMTKNVASNRVMKKCGFLCEGTKRNGYFVSVFADYNIYGLLKSDIMGCRAATGETMEQAGILKIQSVL